MKSPKAKRLFSAFFAAVLLFTSTASALGGGMYYDIPIGIGTTYTRIDGQNSSGVQKASIITYKPGTDVTPIGVRTGTQFYGSKQTLAQAATALQAKGLNVVGGINADFFSFSNGVPTGLVVDDGRLVAANNWQFAVGFNEDGSAVIGMPVKNIVVSGASGKISVFEYNKTRTSVGLYLLDHYYASQTGFSSAGQSIVMEYDDPSTLRIGEPISLTVVNKVVGSDSFPIAENQMVLTRRDDCTSMPWVDFQIGERVTIDFQTDASAWGRVRYAVGGKLLMSNGEITTSGIDSAASRVARSAIGLKADGTVVLYEIDGAQSSYSRGLTALELGQEMKDLGCVTALALDGGGSSAMTIKTPGASEAKVVTSPSDGSLRKCSTFIFLVNNAAATGIPSQLYLEPVSRYVLAGGTVDFVVQAVDSSYHKTALPSSIQYTASSGAVDGAAMRYTAPASAGRVTVNASGDGASGEMALMVISSPTAITLSQNGSAVGALALAAGESATLNANLYFNGVWVSSANSQLKWTVEGGIGTVTENGVFTAARAGSGKLTVSCGNISKTITVSVGLGDPQKLTSVSDFESTQPLTGSAGLTLARTTAIDEIARGAGALRVLCDTSAGTIAPTAPVSVSGLKSLSLWAKTSSGTADLVAAFTDASGQTLLSPLSAQAVTDYALLTAVVPDGATAFTGLNLTVSVEESTVWLDHILLSEHAVTGSTPPAISISSSNTTVSAGETASVTARITQENGTYPVRAAQVTAYVDGVASNAQYNQGTATITVTTGALSAGTHFITIVAADDAGNLARTSVTVNAGTRSDSPFADMQNNWAQSYVDLLSDRGILNGSTGSDGKLYFRPSGNLTRSEFAVIMAKALGLDTSSVGDLPFADVDALPSWARASIAAVNQAGVMSGQLDGNTGRINFNPNAEITRAEVMSVIARCLPRGYAKKTNAFTDAAAIPAWAVDQVNYTASVGIISGYTDGSVKPLGKITRAEIAVVICKFQ